VLRHNTVGLAIWMILEAKFLNMPERKVAREP